MFNLKFIMNLIPMSVFTLYIFGGLFTGSWAFRKDLDGSWVSSLYMGNNRQHISVCAKEIAS